MLFNFIFVILVIHNGDEWSRLSLAEHYSDELS